MYLSLYARGQDEYSWYCEKLTFAINFYLLYKYTKKVWDFQTFFNYIFNFNFLIIFGSVP